MYHFSSVDFIDQYEFHFSNLISAMFNTKVKKRNELSLANKIKVIERHEKDKKLLYYY